MTHASALKIFKPTIYWLNQKTASKQTINQSNKQTNKQTSKETNVQTNKQRNERTYKQTKQNKTKQHRINTTYCLSIVCRFSGRRLGKVLGPTFSRSWLQSFADFPGGLRVSAPSRRAQQSRLEVTPTGGFLGSSVPKGLPCKESFWTWRGASRKSKLQRNADLVGPRVLHKTRDLTAGKLNQGQRTAQAAGTQIGVDPEGHRTGGGSTAVEKFRFHSKTSPKPDSVFPLKHGHQPSNTKRKMVGWLPTMGTGIHLGEVRTGCPNQRPTSW